MKEISANKVLDDQIDLFEETADLMSRFYIHAYLAAYRRGVSWTISHDFDELARVNKDNVDTWEEMLPTINPRYNHLDATNAFWLRGVDTSGRVVVARAARLFSWPNVSLKTQLESLRTFYDAPLRDARPGEVCRCAAAQAGRITGRVSFSVAGWVHPDVRRMKLASLSARLTRAIAWDNWQPDWFIGMIDDDLMVGGKLADAYGSRLREPGIEYRQYGTADLRMWLLWARPADLLADLGGAVAAAA